MKNETVIGLMLCFYGIFTTLLGIYVLEFVHGLEFVYFPLKAVVFCMGVYLIKDHKEGKKNE